MGPGFFKVDRNKTGTTRPTKRDPSLLERSGKSGMHCTVLGSDENQFLEWKVGTVMGYALQIAATAVLAFGVWLFSTGGANPDLSWGQLMLALALAGSASTALSLVGLRRIRTSRAPYWWLSSLIFVSGLVLLTGIFGSYSAGPEGADIGGIFLMILGACGLAGLEIIALLWTLGADLVGLIKPRKRMIA